jgi:hypothetical protein
MHLRKLSLAPAATGLVLANVVVIGVVIACLFVTRRAWDLREDALAALAEARADAQAQALVVTAPAARPLAATVHAPPRRLRATTMDRMLLFGALGVAGSAFFTWLLVTRSSIPVHLRFGSRPDIRRRGDASNRRHGY